ncbi:MAG: type 1 glutamine amidotransferase, partial [Candidatus Bathyarchaeia archaeon]
NERKATLHRVELDEGEPIPIKRDFDAIIAMGGPMSVNDEKEFPWLLDEKRLISEAVRDDVPFYGVCLGVQLLASSLGARVYAGPKPEVGLLPVELTKAALADPILDGLPTKLLTLQWHGDTFDIPKGAVRLARSPAYPNQAFRWGKRAYGLQFHLEVSTDMANKWATIPAYAEYLDRVLGPGSHKNLVEELDRKAKEMHGYGRRIFERWLDLAVQPSTS